MATKVLSEVSVSHSGAQTAVINEKGQIVIPVEIRRRVGLLPGTRVVFWVDGSRVNLQAVEKLVEELPGMFGPGPSLEQMREKDHRDDKER